MRRSECPSPYTSAVSMKSSPASSAACSAATDSVSSTLPQAAPMAQAPKPISPTLRPLRPKDLECMCAPLLWCRPGADDFRTKLCPGRHDADPACDSTASADALPGIGRGDVHPAPARVDGMQ